MITFPQPSIPYAGPINLVPIQGPSGPALAAPIQIAWDPVNPTQVVNLTMAGVGQMGIIQSVFVNNEQNGASVRLIALDTGMVITVPAFSSALLPFTSLSQQIIVTVPYDVGPSGSSSFSAPPDTTYIVFYNTLLPPVAPHGVSPANNAFSYLVALGSTALNIALMPAGKWFTLLNFSLVAVNLVGGTSGSNYSPIHVTDGNGNVIARTALEAQAGATLNMEIYRLNPGGIQRVKNGLTLTSGTPASAPSAGHFVINGVVSLY